METFLVPPDDCVILKAFRDSKSLREAAQLLHCDPAGLARKVQQISNQFGFLQKVNNRWQLTASGQDLVAWTEVSIQSQRQVLAAKSSLRVASTAWLAEEVLIPKLNGLKILLGSGKTFSLHTPNQGFELALLDGSVDFVIACHPPENPEVEHKSVVEEVWTIIAPYIWKKNFGDHLQDQLGALQKLPFVRHRDMNPDILFPSFKNEILESDLVIDNLIGVRSAVVAGWGWSIVPRPAVARYIAQKTLLEIELNSKIQDRKVCVWWLRNRYDSKHLAGKICRWVKDSVSTA